jgi:hypothetical protein
MYVGGKENYVTKVNSCDNKTLISVYIVLNSVRVTRQKFIHCIRYVDYQCYARITDSFTGAAVDTVYFLWVCNWHIGITTIALKR